MKKVLRVISINCLILIISLVIIELIFGSWFIPSNSLSHLGVLRNMNLKLENHLYEDTSKLISYTRDSYGLRGSGAFNDPSKIDILTVGGSTTDQRYISDGLTWQGCLEEKFKLTGHNFLIGNSGIDGQSTFGHLRNFEDWYPLIEGLQPRYVLFYIGINDFYLSEAFAKADQVYRNGAKERSALFNLYRKLKGIFIAKRVRANHRKVNFSNHPYSNHSLLTEQTTNAFQENVDAYQQRIELLIQETEKIGAQPIFVTQPSALYKILDESVVGIQDTFYLNKQYPFNGLDFHTLVKQMNSAIFKACQEDCKVIDLTSTLATREGDYYDWVHMTPQGAAYLCEEIFLNLKSLPD